MMNSFMSMSIGWCLNVGTISRGDSFRESLHIQRTIQKSTSAPFFKLTYWRSCGHRVLIANIRNLGGCPCPRCLIPKAKFHNVATENDMLHCDVLARRDTAGRREKISSARRLIYEEQYVVDTPQVEVLLKPESLVPTVVCFMKL